MCTLVFCLTSFILLLVYTIQLNRSLNVYIFASVKISAYPQSLEKPASWLRITILKDCMESYSGVSYCQSKQY